MRPGREAGKINSHSSFFQSIRFSAKSASAYFKPKRIPVAFMEYSAQLLLMCLINLTKAGDLKMKLLKIIAVPAMFSLLTGCASIVNGTHQEVQVVTPPVIGASCLLSNSKGQWTLPSTPGLVKVHRAYGDLAVSCHKGGYAPANQTVKSKTKAMAFGNLVFGGAIGGGVDAGDGAAYDYPETITLPMHPAVALKKSAAKR